MEQNLKSRMKYLVPQSNDTLDVWLNKRDWDDMHDERHYEYHVQTVRNMAKGNLHVIVHATDVPWTIMLHGTLLLRLLKSRAVKSFVISKAAWHGPVRALSCIMWPGLPADVKLKITFAS